jgi:predicted RNA-binding Zn-ribbon protein involved in translation (DUF1610 family)
MGTSDAQSDAHIALCPSCGARIKAGAGARNRKVQCPKCREIVVLIDPSSKSPSKITAPAPQQAPPAPDQHQLRIAELEVRIAALEKAVAAGGAAAGSIGAAGLRWAPREALPSFSPAQAEVLGDNLRAMRAHRITIQFPSGNSAAREQAEWFKNVFERARWSVHGPETAVLVPARRELALATSLPVSSAVAATYLALRAAGFQPVARFDPDLDEAEERLIVA